MSPAERKNKKVLPFTRPAKEPAPSTIICQIGNERFAIHWQVEDLPPAKPMTRINKKGERPD